MLVVLFVGIVIGVLGLLAWAGHYAPLMQDEPSFLDELDQDVDE